MNLDYPSNIIVFKTLYLFCDIYIDIRFRKLLIEWSCEYMKDVRFMRLLDRDIIVSI